DGIRDRNVTGVQTCALPIWNIPLPFVNSSLYFIAYRLCFLLFLLFVPFRCRSRPFLWFPLFRSFRFVPFPFLSFPLFPLFRYRSRLFRLFPLSGRVRLSGRGFPVPNQPPKRCNFPFQVPNCLQDVPKYPCQT